MKTKMFVLAGAMIMALGLVGIGYAAWNSNLTIYGTLKTGTLKWAFTGVDQLAGFTTAQVTQESYANADTELSITVDKTYPGWKGFVAIKEKNTGTLPLRYESFKFTSTGGTGFAGYYQVAFYYDVPDYTITGPAVVGSNKCNYAAYISTIDGNVISYTSFLPAGYYIDLASGITNPSIVSFYLHPDVPSEWMDIPYTFTFTHTATVALP